MKYFPFIILSLTGLNCIGQTPQSSSGKDTAKQLSRNSISISGGANITYPAVSSSSEAKATVSPEPWGSMSYSLTLRCNKYYSFGIKFGIGAVQYKYNATIFESNGSEIGSLTLQQINEVGISSDIFVNTNISETIGWYNEIGILGEAAVYYLYNPNAGGNNEYQPEQNFTNENEYNLYLYYYTGINIKINKNLTLTPLVAFPLLNITVLFPKNSSTYSANTYNSFRTGLMLTYNFNKR